jgi:hypothetical protein
MGTAARCGERHGGLNHWTIVNIGTSAVEPRYPNAQVNSKALGAIDLEWFSIHAGNFVPSRLLVQSGEKIRLASELSW